MITRDLFLAINAISVEDIAQANLIVKRLSLTEEKIDTNAFIEKLPKSIGSVIKSIYEFRKSILVDLFEEDKGRNRIGIDEVHQRLMSMLSEDLSSLTYDVTVKLQFLIDLTLIKTKPGSSLDELFDSNVFMDTVRVSLEVFRECVLKKRNELLGVTCKVQCVITETEKMIKDLKDANGDDVVEDELLRIDKKQNEVLEKINMLEKAIAVNKLQIQEEKDDADGLIHAMQGIEEGIYHLKRKNDPENIEVVHLLNEKLMNFDSRIRKVFGAIDQYQSDEQVIELDIKSLKATLVLLSKDKNEWFGIRRKIEESLKPRLVAIELDKKNKITTIMRNETTLEEVTRRDLESKLQRVLDKAINTAKPVSLAMNSDLWNKKEITVPEGQSVQIDELSVAMSLV